MVSLSNTGPTAVRVIHDEGALELTEASARSLVDILRNAAAVPNALEVTADLWNSEVAVSLYMTPERTLAYCGAIEHALGLWHARCVGQPIARTATITRDSDKEITEIRTAYTY